MGLTADVELLLRDSGLIDFFQSHKDAFTEMAEESYVYAHRYVSQAGLPLRRDDVAKVLVPALVTNDRLRECLAQKKLRQKFYYSHFADLILDRTWEELSDDETA